MSQISRVAAATLTVLLLVACGEPKREVTEQPATPEPRLIERTIPAEQNRQAFFGDLHMHTALSIDAYITGTRTLPEDAYRYARGEPIDHVSGEKIRIHTPLDFLAVTDHSEIIGVAWAMGDPDSLLSKAPIAERITSTDFEVSQQAFREIVQSAASGDVSIVDRMMAEDAIESGWQRLIDAAEAANEPGKFTTFIGYEWSSMPNLANLHRNVIFRGSKVPALPFSSNDSNRPEDLWAFLESWRKEGGDDVIAIPHNSNASKGLMFALENSDGLPIDAAYAETRSRNEPLVEITQFKGTSETHTALAPNDEFADFELWNTTVGAPQPIDPVPGGYVRNAYGRGLALEAQIGANPYKFGLVGASDSHDSSSAVEENNFTGGHGNADATPQTRLHSRPSTLVASSLSFSAAGLTGVWAESNTRESLFDAFRRKETFATSGTRIRVRFFAGDTYPDDLPGRTDAVALAYAGGVPMGGDLVTSATGSPAFYVHAARDANSAALARVQIVKVWANDGKEQEAIFDVACSDGGTVDATTQRCPDNGATVDLATCAPSADKGAGELSALWRDPTFVAGQKAAYYARVLENPTCRWSTWDALRLGEAPPADVPATIRERAFSSPIWVSARPPTELDLEAQAATGARGE